MGPSHAPEPSHTIWVSMAELCSWVPQLCTLVQLTSHVLALDAHETCPQLLEPVHCTSQLCALHTTELAHELTPEHSTVHALPAHCTAPMQLCRPQWILHEEAFRQSTPAAHVLEPHSTSQGMLLGQAGLQALPSTH